LKQLDPFASDTPARGGGLRAAGPLRLYLLALLFTYLVILVIIGLSTWLRLADFTDYQRGLAEGMSRGAAAEISRLISGTERRIENFVRYNREPLSSLSHDPSDAGLLLEIASQLEIDLPEAFTFTIAERNGTPLLEDIESLVGAECRVDIRRYGQTHENLVRLHPSPNADHFDIMGFFRNSRGQGRVFFVSVEANILSTVLESHQLPGYQLYLVSRDKPDWIDIGADNSRQNLARPASFNSAEIDLINARSAVAGSNWDLVALPDIALFSDRFGQIMWRSLLAFVIATVMMVSITWLIIQQHITRARGQQRYQMLFRGNRAPMMLIDPDSTRIIDANDAAVEFYGYDKERFTQMELRDITNLSNEQLTACVLRAVTGQRDDFKAQHRLAGGDVRDVEVRAGPIMMDGRQLLFAIISDITARTFAERALRESEARFKTLTNLSPVGTFFTDGNGHCLYVNKAWAQITGIPQQDWQGKHWTDVLIDEDRYGVRTEFELMVEQNSAFEVECRLLNHAGEVRWILCRAAANLPTAENPDMYVGTAVDITERMLIEHEIRLMATAFESHEPILVSDGQGHMLKVNHAFTRLTGYTERELIGRSPAILKSGKHDEEFYAEMWRTLQRQGVWSGEIYNRAKSGELLHMSLTITAVYDEDGDVTNYIGHYQDITERKQAEEQIRRLAFYDPLTSLPNRRLFLERLEQELNIARREGQHGALLFLDLDHFKNLNDSLGHPVGDALLVEVSRRLQGGKGKGEVIARIGGDEFVILLPNSTGTIEQLSANAERRAQEINRRMNEPFYIHGHEYHITVSIGIALFPERNMDSTDILKRADTAMYRAKQAGRNAACFFEKAMQIDADRRLVIEKDLRHAIRQQELFLVYQPMIDWEGQVMGAECLLRWQHKQLGLIPPADFIPIAEDTGLIAELSEWIINQACLQLLDWRQREACQNLRSLSINLSPKEFSQSHFESLAQEILAYHGIAPGMIEFEITERLIIHNLESTIERMKRMKRHGFRFSIDDFGTGYSSLAYLKQLPIDRLKIDRSFVRDITEDRSAATIVETIISMAHHLGLEVVAEGVENQEQHYFLMQNACDIYQGYFFSKPLSPGDFTRFEVISNVAV